MINFGHNVVSPHENGRSFYKDENDVATRIGCGTLKIPYTNKKGDTGFINVNVVFEKRLCEAYTNNWMKWSSSSSGYTHWYSNGEKLLKD